jgi:N utilization substance protein B
VKPRRRSRESALQALYYCDSLGDFSAAARAGFVSHFEAQGELGEGEDVSSVLADEFFNEILLGVTENLERIDKAIGLASTHWSVARMSMVDRNILRIATYELMLRDDVPPKVAINEAIEISKCFAAPDAPMFINGVLDKVAEHLAVIPKTTVS